MRARTHRVSERRGFVRWRSKAELLLEKKRPTQDRVAVTL